MLLPGLVDTHVHVNEPGRTEWEGFATATRAAAAGGVTTILDMPLNSIPPTTTVAALEVKREVAEGQCFVDVGFWGGAVPGNLADLEALHEAGVFGFKCFLLDSGVAEFPHLPPDAFAAAMAETARLGALMIVHAEDGELIDETALDGVRYAGFLASRPKSAEEAAIALVVEQARVTRGRAHVVHLSDADAVPLLRSARADGVDVSVETCPHYLTFEAEQVADGATELKCCPPIREADNREALWAALGPGDIDLVVSDHSPCTASLKESADFGLAWGGIASVQLGLPAVWTGARARGFSLVDVVRWMATAPADRVGLLDRGRIAVGAQADLVRFAPDASFTVDPSRLKHKNPVSAYAGHRLAGEVRETWLRGVPVDDDAPRGQLLEKRNLMASLPRAARRAAAADRADDRPRAVHRGVRRDPGAHAERHHRLLPARLGPDADVGAGAAAVGVRRDVQPVRRGARGPAAVPRSPEVDPAAEAVLFVVSGTLALTVGATSYELAPGGYAYLPPGSTWTLHNETEATGDVPLDPQELPAGRGSRGARGVRDQRARGRARSTCPARTARGRRRGSSTSTTCATTCTSTSSTSSPAARSRSRRRT